MKSALLPVSQSWPMSTTATVTVAASCLATFVVGLTFRWEPGSIRRSGQRCRAHGG